MTRSLARLFALFASALGCAAEHETATAQLFIDDAGAPGDVTKVTLATPDGGGVAVARDVAPVPVVDRPEAPVTPDAACSTTTAETRRVPVNLLVVLDRSGSMNNTPASPTRWASAVSALEGLLDGLDDDIRVGLTFFPSLTGASDQPASYVTPVVAIEPLGDNRARLVSTLRAARPLGETPMVCAMRGAVQAFRSFPRDGSRHVVLITDGQPTSECAMDVLCNPPTFATSTACSQRTESLFTDAVRSLVTLATRETPPIHTYVAGTPEASDAFLSDLALAGETARSEHCLATTPPSCHYSLSTGTFEADLTRALEDIRVRSLSCEFEVQADPARVDAARVNVNFSGTSSPTPVLIPRDVTRRDGWDYSNGMRSVVLYGPACERVRGDSRARVQILFGCPTVTPG